MKNQRFKLTTALIVSALHPNEPFPDGTIWEPSNGADQSEARELVQSGYAVEHEATKDDVVVPTLDQARIEAARKESQPDDEDDGSEGDDADLKSILDGSVESVAGELDGLDHAQLHRLAELENAGKQRVGVGKAIEAALEALGPQE